MLFHGKQADKALTFKAFYPRLSLAGSTVNQVFLPSFCKVITYSLHLQRLANYELALVQKPCHHAYPGAASRFLAKAEYKHVWGTVNFIPALGS